MLLKLKSLIKFTKNMILSYAKCFKRISNYNSLLLTRVNSFFFLHIFQNLPNFLRIVNIEDPETVSQNAHYVSQRQWVDCIVRTTYGS